jgi:tetratricopeptide (TPR) repeat protein
LSPRQEDFAWRWYHVMPRVLDSLGQKPLARGIETQAAQKWHLDMARAEYLQGVELESKGSHEPAALTSIGPTAYDKAGARASYFVRASELFTRALQRRPDLTVAALHLGRVRMLQGNGSEARALFRSALTDVDPAVRYLAALFLGSIEEREERLDDAEKLYRDALQYMPYGQSAPLALSELLSRTGREAEARSVLAARVLRVNAQVVEPFWAYGPLEDVATPFDLLRVEVWK